MKRRIEDIKEFFISIKKEIKKIKWLSRKNTIKYSLSVIFFIIFISLFFILSDLMIALLTYIKELF